MRLTHIVTMEEGGSALLHVLRKGMGLSGTLVKRLKAADGILVDGEPRFTNWTVAPGQCVTADLDAAEAPGDSSPERGPLDVLYEDEGLLAVNKPPGMIVHPSRARYAGTLSNFVAGYLLDRGENPACHAVNRLDRDTSGIVLFAKNAHMKHLAARAMAEGKKRYTAVACGVLSPARGAIDLPIRRARERDMLRIVSPDGQRAVTHYVTTALGELAGSPYSVLDIVLETGRTHQIRVHCLAAGAPLAGDPLYKTEQSEALGRAAGARRQLLHSGQLTLLHPLTGGRLDIRAPVSDPVMLRLMGGASPYLL